jgi:hypothetical protein
MDVVNKDTGKMYEVYDITYDKAGYPHFLIYKDNQWVRMSAKHFKPIGEVEEFNNLIDKWSGYKG